MAESNAQLQKDKRPKEKALLKRIGAEKRSIIVSNSLDNAMLVIGERHCSENGRRRSRRSSSTWQRRQPKRQLASPICRYLNSESQKSSCDSSTSVPKPESTSTLISPDIETILN
ncbi:hypothetical protein [Pseudomonas monsensis]|uniref:hypothetical protein n=1 Tax=Pseudomonas monsensis TaxID=2745509 RepID=UPI003D2565CC